MCSKMRREISEAFDACWHEVCRAQPRSCNARLKPVNIGKLFIFCFNYSSFNYIFAMIAQIHAK